MLNENQNKFVNSNSKKIVCLAGAGTGKTYSMITRIERLVSDGINPAAILVLTFTEAAAYEMKSRYISNCSSRITPKFCTFHSFCFSLISNDIKIQRFLNYSKCPKLIDENKYKEVLTTHKKMLGIKLSDSKLYKDVYLTQFEKSQKDAFFKSIDKYMKSNNLITFDMMCYDVCKLFKDNQDVIKPYKQQYKYIFVDEFQDTDKKQFEFVTSFENSNIAVVGDSQQAIYSFRGADSSIIKSITQDPTWETTKLNQNYRSTIEIVEFANRINPESEYKVDLVSDIHGDKVVVKNISNLEEYIKEIVFGDDIGTTAILARSNREVNEIINSFKKLNIDYTCKSTDTITIQNLFSCILDTSLIIPYLAAQLSVDRYSDYIRISNSNQNEITIDQFLDKWGDYNICKSYETICKLNRILNSPDTPYKQCLKILSELNLYSNKEFILEGSSKESKLSSILKFIDSNDMSSNIYIGTIHSVKGLEYDNVYLLGVNSRSFKIDNEETRNIYYVGCTRAKKKLTICRGSIVNETY